MAYREEELEKAMMNDFDAIMIAEGVFGDEVSYEEQQAAWQHLHSTGLAYRLQGGFGRTAQRLIDEGVIDA